MSNIKRGNSFRITIDQGGTFADGVLVDDQQIYVAKAATNIEDPADSIMRTISLLAKERGLTEYDLLGNTTAISLGTTLGTNAILEDKGARCCLIHTKGFRDVFELGRTIPKNDIYNLKVLPPKVLIPRYLRFGVEERIQYDGKEVTPLNEEDVRAAVKKAKSYNVEVPVVGFLHSYVNPDHEEKAAEIIAEEYPNVVVSSRIMRRWIEYERFSTATFAAYVKPKLTQFVQDLQVRLADSGFRGALLFTTALGDVTTAELALENPANIIDSGVANGALMACFISEQVGFNDVLSFDMGGTSADIGVLKDQVPAITTDKVIGDQKNAMESMDINSIGAGGGSIAWVDRLGVLRVGPKSTGANPGPACYAKGGKLPSITDANVVLGYIPPDYFLGGTMPLDASLAEKAIKEEIAKPLGIDIVKAAYSIASLAEAIMGEQVFLSIVEKGYNPRDFALVTGGGAGPVHAIAIAKRLGMKTVYIPKHAGVFSALGGAVANYGYFLNRFLYRRDDQVEANDMKDLYDSMEQEAVEIFVRQGISIEDMVLVRGAEVRYFGQLHDIYITLPEVKIGGSFGEAEFRELIATFHNRHKALYGWGDTDMPLLIAMQKVRAIAKRKPLALIEKERVGPDAASALKRHRHVYFKENNGFIETPCYAEDLLKPGNIITGPAIIEESKTTVVIPLGSEITVDAFENYLVKIS